MKTLQQQLNKMMFEKSPELHDILTCPKLNWDEMLHGIRHCFQHDTVNIDDINKIMLAYESNETDWAPYAYFDPYRYTRNLIDKGNGKYNLMLLCWGPDMLSGIHDHSNSHCFVKVLQGQLTEELYRVTEDCGDLKMFTKGKNHYTKNQVSYINDSIGVHRMSNQDHIVPAVSLHLYCPPFDACRTFDENNGKTNKCSVTFYSLYGERVKILGTDRDKINQTPSVITPSFIATK